MKKCFGAKTENSTLDCNIITCVAESFNIHQGYSNNCNCNKSSCSCFRSGSYLQGGGLAHPASSQPQRKNS